MKLWKSKAIIGKAPRITDEFKGNIGHMYFWLTNKVFK